MISRSGFNVRVAAVAALAVMGMAFSPAVLPDSKVSGNAVTPRKGRTPDSAAADAAKAALRNKQFAAAVQQLRAAADHGDAQSEYLLGLVYANGVGVEASPDEARRWLEAAARQADPDAAFALAGVLASGSTPDPVAAQQWLTRAAAEGHPVAAKLIAGRMLPLAPSREAAGGTAFARELLVWAIRHSDEPTVEAFTRIAGVDTADEFGRTPLAYAVTSGSESAVRYFLAAGADAARADRFGVTPLMLAAEAESDAALDALLSGAGTGTHTGIDAQDSAGDTALFYAARVGRTAHVARLVAAGAAFDLSNTDGWTAVDVAAKGDHPETVQVLRKAGATGHLKASVNHAGSGIDPRRGGELYQGWPPVAVAASRNEARGVAELLADGARVDEPTPHRDTALLVAAKYRAAAVVAPLLKAGADPAQLDENGETALGYAAAHGALDVLDALLQKGVSPDTRGRAEEPALVRAIRARDDEAVKRLIEAGADVNLRSPGGATALMVASGLSEPQVMQILIGAGAQVYPADRTGHDALWLAVDAGNREGVDLLLSAGAPVDSNRSQPSPLFAAIHAGRAALLEHLLRKGLSPNATAPGSGDTPLIAAAARGEPELVRVLVEGGATIDAQDAAGNTALLVATREGHTDACKVLLKGGANVRIRNVDRIDALDTAKRRNLSEIVALLDTG